MNIKCLFNFHNFECIAEAEGSADLTDGCNIIGKNLVILELYKCSECGKEKAIVRHLHGWRELDLIWCKKLLKQAGKI